MEAEYITIRTLIDRGADHDRERRVRSDQLDRGELREAPANTITDIPTASASPSPALTAAMPATSPNGTIPSSSGDTSRTPAQMSPSKELPSRRSPSTVTLGVDGFVVLRREVVGVFQLHVGLAERAEQRVNLAFGRVRAPE